MSSFELIDRKINLIEKGIASQHERTYNVIILDCLNLPLINTKKDRKRAKNLWKKQNTSTSLVQYMDFFDEYKLIYKTISYVIDYLHELFTMEKDFNTGLIKIILNGIFPNDISGVIMPYYITQ